MIIITTNGIYYKSRSGAQIFYLSDAAFAKNSVTTDIFSSLRYLSGEFFPNCFL